VRATDWSVNWRRVTVLVAVAVIALAVFRWVAVPSVPAQPPPPPQHVAADQYEVEPSPGCKNRTGADDAPVPAGRPVARPARPVPFFAPRSGTLPPDGTPTVGGVKLPRGSRCAHRWATDTPVADAAFLADRLVAVFPETGLWPVLWDFDPDEYADDFAESPAAVARLDVEKVLRRAARRHLWPRDLPFRGLARGSTGPQPAEFAPFAEFARSRPEHDWGQEDPFLVLVPTNRPADVIVHLGQPESELIRDAAVSAVLRSWEERFGAVVTVVGPGSMDVVAATPPHTEEDILRLAAEQYAIAPETGYRSVHQIARELRTERRGAFMTPRHGVFGWPD
jgi:uncharacterized protein DUF4253